MRDKELTLDSEVFADLRWEFDRKLQTLIEGMVKRGISTGTITAKVTISMEKEYVRLPEDPENVLNGLVLHPEIETKVSAGMTVKSEEKYFTRYDDHNMVKGADERWCMRPADEYQMTLADMEDE